MRELLHSYDVLDLVVHGYTSLTNQAIQKALKNAQNDHLKTMGRRMENHSILSK